MKKDETLDKVWHVKLSSSKPQVHTKNNKHVEQGNGGHGEPSIQDIWVEFVRVLGPSLLMQGVRDTKKSDEKRRQVIHDDLWREIEAKAKGKGRPETKNAVPGDAIPGDIVLIATPSLPYDFARSLTNQEYDHAVVVLEHNRALHVSPPLIRTLQVEEVLLKSKKPLVLRPRLNDAERRSFLEGLESMIGKRYPLSQLFLSMANLMVKKYSNNMKNLFMTNAGNLGANVGFVCTDTILHCLGKSGKRFQIALRDEQSCLDFQVGTKRGGSLNDFIALANLRPDLLTRIETVERRDSMEWAANIGVDFVFVHNDENAGSNKNTRFQDRFPQLRRFGLLGRWFDFLQQVGQWLISRGDVKLMNRFITYVRESSPMLAPLLDSNQMKSLLYVASLYVLWRQGNFVWSILWNSMKLMILRRLFLTLWNEIHLASNL